MTRRPIIIANCAGALTDEGFHMYRQATEGPVDAITGDWLAELNIATNAKAYKAGAHQGWEKNCEEALLMCLEVIQEKRIKVVFDGGAQNPKGLAELVNAEAVKKGLDLKISYVYGDDLYANAETYLQPEYELKHLDSNNDKIKISAETSAFFANPNREIVSCNAYLGGRSIVAGLNAGADVIICGRVADASPIIALAAWWHGWKDTDYDRLAGALLAGHLIECSGYTTGANFCDFDRYPMDKLIDIGYPIAEIASDGTFIITKHESLNGFVNVDTCRSQLLYELQGEMYLNSDVTADVSKVIMKQKAKNRVEVSGIRGFPPPPTTKLALFYVGGYQAEFMVCGTGTNMDAKFELQERQVRRAMEDFGIQDKFDVVEFQRLAHADENPDLQNHGTSFLRIFVQAREYASVIAFGRACRRYGMQHFHGASFSFINPFEPREFVVYYPGLIEQLRLDEGCIILGSDNSAAVDVKGGHVPRAEALGVRKSYETAKPVDLSMFGATVRATLDTFVLGRSGDKGANVNLGLYVHQDDEYEWLKSFATGKNLQYLIGEDWKDTYFIERVEMPNILAVHFVVYGILGRGVSSSTRLDSLGKAFADYIRSKVVAVPEVFVKRYEGVKYDN
ncbi:hypothetical protein BABINDRAFT_39059 [Babjeviella inositovora NRRL Y-12698]|uniref:DUF1446 domain-containing protein n=1 Tax=Babjeviella inositovora NRRL Y-12698 TaxID=984486 RepID=A0A1E3QMN4_9ASCO|nr:uncharacterized protein BABINDRAFT_39059 [Babjeviella inositovora NRRL Y-12698]ODQ78900.1 hypothetical protein BABINDRAFT_39059 [Babjeviella inositovora NRRL Y-12698]